MNSLTLFVSTPSSWAICPYACELDSAATSVRVVSSWPFRVFNALIVEPSVPWVCLRVEASWPSNPSFCPTSPLSDPSSPTMVLPVVLADVSELSRAGMTVPVRSVRAFANPLAASPARPEAAVCNVVTVVLPLSMKLLEFFSKEASSWRSWLSLSRALAIWRLMAWYSSLLASRPLESSVRSNASMRSSVVSQVFSNDWLTVSTSFCAVLSPLSTWPAALPMSI